MKTCKGCTERTEGCHIDCIVYKIWLASKEKHKAEERKRTQTDRDLKAYTMYKSATFGHMVDFTRRRKNEI